MVQARYHLIDCARVEPIKDSFLSVLFQLERASGGEELKDALVEFSMLVREVVTDALILDFQVWLRFVLERKYKGVTLTHEQLQVFFPEDSMFTFDRTNIDKALDEIDKEVYERGAAAGLEKGLEQGRRQVLAMLLEKKFGEDDSREARLKGIDASSLDAAVSLLLDAEEEEAFWRALSEATAG